MKEILEFEDSRKKEWSKEVLKESKFYLIFKAGSWNLKQISVCSKGKYLNIFRNSLETVLDLKKHIN